MVMAMVINHIRHHHLRVQETHRCLLGELRQLNLTMVTHLQADRKPKNMCIAHNQDPDPPQDRSRRTSCMEEIMGEGIQWISHIGMNRRRHAQRAVGVWNRHHTVSFVQGAGDIFNIFLSNR